MSEWHAHVLVVEDEPFVAQEIALRLAALGYGVIGPVGTAADALRMAAIEHPDLVLMDVELAGDMDGVEAARQLQQLALPVVYVTAHAEAALLERAKITEPLGYLVKPYSERELHAAVIVALYRHRMKCQLADAHMKLERAHLELERKVEERTAHLAELNRRLVQEAAERVQIEQALRESERHLRQIIDLVPHRICVKNVDGRFLLVNQAAAAVYGLTPEAMTGRCHRELHADTEQLERMLADDRAVIEHGDCRINREETFTGADGLQRVLRTTKIPYRIPGQEQPAVLCLAMDITEQKRNEQRLIASEEKYRAILENAVDAIFLCEMDGRIVDANRRAGELLGYTKEELCGMTAEGLHPAEERARLHEVFGRLANDGTTLVVHPVLRKDGRVIYCEVAATPIRIGDQRLAQGIFRDVTERERLAEERIAQAKQHRDTLVREVHHRIKNNLQGVVGLLREHANAHPELTEVISSAIGQVQSISVVHGLHGQGDDLQVRLCDMVRAIAGNAGTLTRTAVELDLAVEQPIRIDKDEAVPVALIINELILNAVKHGTGRSGKSSVTVRVSQSGRSAEICVLNPGTLSEDFDFAVGRTTGAGTGLGLVRSLLPHAGAELRLEQIGSEVRASLLLGPPVVSH